MKVLKGILNESKEYYQNLEKEIKNRILQSPKGSIKKRNINGNIYFYLQVRHKDKIKHKYLGKFPPEKLYKQIEERKKLYKELKQVKEALKILKRTERKRHVRNYKKNI